MFPIPNSQRATAAVPLAADVDVFACEHLPDGFNAVLLMGMIPDFAVMRDRR